MKNLVTEILSNYPIMFSTYIASTLIVFLALVIRRFSRKKRYIEWKNDKISILGFTREWERNDDELLQELFTENEMLINQNRVIQRKYLKLSLLTLIITLGAILMNRISSKKEKTEESKP